jgi:hypothetical protein
MSLARAWTRQLFGASSAALIVPSATLGALLVLALGGGFRQVGVLGQIFAGPPAPSVSGVMAGVGAGGGSVARSLPVIPAAAVVPRRAGAGAGERAGAGHRHSHRVPVSSRGPGQTGGTLVPVGGVAPIVSPGTTSPVRTAPVGSGRAQPSPQPGPSPSPKPQPTPVDRIVNAVTPVTEQLPAPVGPAATQAVESAGSAADGVSPLGGGSGVKLP